MGRKIAIVGAGAVGGYTGAHMVQAGEDVTFIDPWPAHVDEMRKHGLRVIHAMDVPEFNVAVRALHVTDVQQLAKEKPIDIAFVCMKSYDTAWAASADPAISGAGRLRGVAATRPDPNTFADYKMAVTAGQMPASRRPTKQSRDSKQPICSAAQALFGKEGCFRFPPCP